MTRYFRSIPSEFPCFHTLQTAQLQKLLCTGRALWAYLFQASSPAQLFSLESYRKMTFEQEKKHLSGDINHVHVLNLLSHAICCSSHNTWSSTCLCCVQSINICFSYQVNKLHLIALKALWKQNWHSFHHHASHQPLLRKSVFQNLVLQMFSNTEIF